jgi:hypothetical protein
VGFRPSDYNGLRDRDDRGDRRRHAPRRVRPHHVVGLADLVLEAMAAASLLGAVWFCFYMEFEKRRYLAFLDSIENEG